MSNGKEINVDLFEENLKELQSLVDSRNVSKVGQFIQDMHPADIAEFIDEMEIEDVKLVLSTLDNEVSAAVLLEVDEDKRKEIFQLYSNEEIAQKVIDEVDSDDAADIINELPNERKQMVISKIEDQEFAKDVISLLQFPEDTAGSLMDKEFIKVYSDWNVIRTIKELRLQAEQVSHIYTIYVVDTEDRLIGTLSLKKLLTATTQTKVEGLYNDKVRYCIVDTPISEVDNRMRKYDLFVIPVVDQLQRLVGRITLDDVIDVTKEESERDYQMASGLYTEVEAEDSIVDITKSRLPWLLLGLMGGMVSAHIIGLSQGAMEQFPELFFFTPLIAAMGGNVGVQSSAIVVQALANNSLRGGMWNRFFKEVKISLLNAFFVSLFINLMVHILHYDYLIGITVAVSLILVIVIAALIGTFVPIFLDKRKIDPAIATGPFITTSNDILGLIVYFKLAHIILQF